VTLSKMKVNTGERINYWYNFTAALRIISYSIQDSKSPTHTVICLFDKLLF
jgi:hypothetical protein